MDLSDKQVAFLHKAHAAAMVTLRADGTPHAVRVGVALVDGRLWSSGTQDRTRTPRLRRDPRCTLFVFDPGFAWLALETRVASCLWLFPSVGLIVIHKDMPPKGRSWKLLVL